MIYFEHFCINIYLVKSYVWNINVSTLFDKILNDVRRFIWACFEEKRS